MISRNRKAKTLSVGFILSTLLLSVSATAATSITGIIVAVDELANIVITLPEGQPVPGIGDRVELTRPAKGHTPTVNLIGSWTVTEVNNALIYAGLQELSEENRPRENENVDIFLSDVRAEKEQGRPIKTNKSYAERLRITCEQGDMPACVDLGLMYKHGDRVMKNGPEAVKLIKAAAERGYARAQYELAILYRHPVGLESNTITRKSMIEYKEMVDLSEKWLEKAAGQGDASAMRELGNLAHEKKYYGYMKKMFTEAAERGDREAQNSLGDLYRSDLINHQPYLKKRNVFKVDDQKARYWLHKAAEQHHEIAQYNLASMFDEGRGGARDQEKAIYWYRRSANNGFSLARSALEEKEVPLQGPQEISSRKRKDVPALRGVHVTNLTNAVRKQHNLYIYIKGVMVAEVETGSPAEDLLLPGDVITAINGKLIKKTSDYETLPYINLTESKSLKIKVKREDYVVDVELPLFVQDKTKGKEWTAERIDFGVQESEDAPSTTVDGIADDLGEL